jgi:excisionase family DNA binding protein
MNREQAADELGMSVRSLQRAVANGHLSVTYQRGKSGKQEAHFDADEIARYKTELETKTVIPSHPIMATTGDTALARIDAPAFITVLERIAAVAEGAQPPTTTHDARGSVAIENKPLLKLAEASALTGLSREILRDAIDAGKLKAKMIGRAWRIKRPDLDLYIKKL